MKRYAIIGFGCAGESAAKAPRPREAAGALPGGEAPRDAPAAGPRRRAVAARGRPERSAGTAAGIFTRQ